MAGRRDVIVVDAGTGVRGSWGRRAARAHAHARARTRVASPAAWAGPVRRRCPRGHDGRACAQFIKAGFAGDNFPTFMFPSCVGRPILRAEEEAFDAVVLKARLPAAAAHTGRGGADDRRARARAPQDVMCGDDAIRARRALDIRYPIENGVIRNWEVRGGARCCD